jgi:hypothetical protein
MPIAAIASQNAGCFRRPARISSIIDAGIKYADMRIGNRNGVLPTINRPSWHAMMDPMINDNVIDGSNQRASLTGA